MNQPCKHEHLKFSGQGRILACIDCPRKWHTMTDRGQADVGYMHPTLSELDTRHGMFVVPRTKPEAEKKPK